MKRKLLLFVLLSAPLILATLPDTKIQTSANPSTSDPQWIKYTQCYGPSFPLDPTEYVKTETDTFNLTKNGAYVGNGIGLTCGPVGTGANTSATGVYPVTSPLSPSVNSTDLHWSETNTITPKSVGAPPNILLNRLFQNVTERFYVNGKEFANVSLVFNGTSTGQNLNFTLYCQLNYPWTVQFQTLWNFTFSGSTTTGGGLNLSPCPTQLNFGLTAVTAHFDDFHLLNIVNATYTPANQPQSLRKVVNLNGKPLDRTYIDLHNLVLPPTSCDGVLAFNQYTIPPPLPGDLGLVLSQDPVWVVQGATQTWPFYLQLLPNNPPSILSDSMKIDALGLVPPPIPPGILLQYDSRPPVPSPPFGPSAIPSLTSNTIPLQLTANPGTPQGVYRYNLTITDQTTSKVANWGVARIVVCPVTATTLITPIQLLLTGCIMGLLIVAQRTIRATTNLGRVRSPLRS